MHLTIILMKVVKNYDVRKKYNFCTVSYVEEVPVDTESCHSM